VVPSSAVFCGLELVGLDIARCQSTFGNAVCTVLDVRVQHAKAMPVNRRAVSLKHIAYCGKSALVIQKGAVWLTCNPDRVSPIGYNCRSRIASIDKHTDPAVRTVRIASCILNPEIVRHCLTSIRPRGVHVGRGRYSR
jgi:hypothetical protein